MIDSLSFNPRPREGGDIPLPVCRCPLGRFNPRPREGGDEIIAAMLFSFVKFQPTPP